VDDHEFESLVRENEPMIRSLIYHITRDSNDVEDVAQEVFLKAYRSLGAFRGGSFRAYLGRIARNHCYDVLRRRKAAAGIRFVEGVPDDWPSVEKGPEDTVIADELAGEVRHILNDLQPSDREILLLRHVHQLRCEEIALVLGITPGAVRTRLTRARRRVLEEVERRNGHAALDLG
jgi:RNA polymerase sigma-70 factor (ECF subfamily)